MGFYASWTLSSQIVFYDISSQINLSEIYLSSQINLSEIYLSSQINVINP